MPTQNSHLMPYTEKVGIKISQKSRELSIDCCPTSSTDRFHKLIPKPLKSLNFALIAKNQNSPPYKVKEIKSLCQEDVDAF